MFDGCTNCRFQLNDFNPGVLDDLVVDDDIQVQLVIRENALDGPGRHPNIVGVEDAELLDGGEVAFVLGRDLRNFQQANLAIVVDDRAALNVGFGLVRDLHDELSPGLDHVIQDGRINGGPQIVDVGNEQVLDALVDEIVKQAALVQRVVDVSVSGWVPARFRIVRVLRNGKRGILLDAGEPALLEGDNADIPILVLSDNFNGLHFGVERVHEEEGQMRIVLRVEAFDLSDRQIEETHPVPHFNRTFGSNAAHGGSQPPVELQNGQFVPVGGGPGFRCGAFQFSVRDDQVDSRFLDFVPVEGPFRLAAQVAQEETEEAVHFSYESSVLLVVLLAFLRGNRHESVQFRAH